MNRKKNIADNMEKISVAIAYGGEGAPKVTAKGRGPIGNQILVVAREHGVPIRENKELTEALARVPMGEEIPESLYIAVAEVLAFIYALADQVLDENPGQDE